MRDFIPLVSSRASSSYAGGSIGSQTLCTVNLGREAPRPGPPMPPVLRVRLQAAALLLPTLEPPHLDDNIDMMLNGAVDPAAVMDEDFVQEPFPGTGPAQVITLHPRLLQPFREQLGGNGAEVAAHEGNSEERDKAVVHPNAPVGEMRHLHSHHHHSNVIMQVVSPVTTLVVGFVAAFFALRTIRVLAIPRNNTANGRMNPRNDETDFEEDESAAEGQVLRIPMVQPDVGTFRPFGGRSFRLDEEQPQESQEPTRSMEAASRGESASPASDTPVTPG